MGGSSLPGPYTITTSAPADRNSDASRTPVLPELRFVIIRTGSICSAVGPAVRSMRIPLSGDGCPPPPPPGPNFSITWPATCSGSDTFALPSIICGPTNSTPFSLRNCMLRSTAGFPYIDSCMAGHTTIGMPEPNATVSTADTGVSSIPFASLPRVLAVAGYTMTRSDLP